MVEYPADWKVCKLGEKASISRGGSPRPIQNWLTTADDGVNWIKIGDVAPGARYITRTAEKIRPEGVQFSRYVHKGDFILSNSMSFGRPYVLQVEGCIHDGWLSIQKYQQTFDTGFLYYILSAQEVMAQYIAMAAGSSVKNLNKDKVNKVVVPVPPLSEQKRIAAVLSNADNLIANVENRIAKKRAVKQGAMQELLTGKKRLPGFSGDWKEVKLGEIGELYSGLTGKTAAYFGHGDAFYITFLNVLSNVVIDTKQVDKVDIGLNEKQHGVKRGDLFFNVSSETPEEVAMCAVLLRDMPHTYLNSFCCGFRLNSDSNLPLYISYYFNSEVGREIVRHCAQGLTRYNLSKKAFLSVSMDWPELLEQQAIAKVLSSMDAEIANLERKLEKLKLIKQGMMQDLLTGKVRLK